MSKGNGKLTKKDLQKFRDLLLAKRNELLGSFSSMEREALKSESSDLSKLPMHMADLGTDNYDRDFTLGLMDSERKLLREIDEALDRIENGNYGICIGSGKMIPKPRLEAIPWAKYCVEYARLLEKGLVNKEDPYDQPYEGKMDYDESDDYN